jgi:hypothetical protein
VLAALLIGAVSNVDTLGVAVGLPLIIIAIGITTGGGSRFGRLRGRVALGRHAGLIAGMLLLSGGAATLPNT